MSTEQAASKFGHGCSCSQAILEAFGPELGLSLSDCHRLASGFGGGMQMGETCGAVTGAFMVLGLKYGPQTADDPSRKGINAKIEAFTREFEKRCGSTCCRDLLGCDLRTEAGQKRAREENLFRTICPEMVQTASEILEAQL